MEALVNRPVSAVATVNCTDRVPRRRDANLLQALGHPAGDAPQICQLRAGPSALPDRLARTVSHDLVSSAGLSLVERPVGSVHESGPSLAVS